MVKLLGRNYNRDGSIQAHKNYYNEKFLTIQDAVDFLKLKKSYGSPLGSVDVIDINDRYDEVSKFSMRFAPVNNKPNQVVVYTRDYGSLNFLNSFKSTWEARQ